MNQTRQPGPAVTFYGAVPGCRTPVRADPSVLGTLPSRGFQYCEALRAASSFGWYVFPPIDFTLQWDGSEIIWTYRGAKGWYPLTSAQFPGYSVAFDRAAPKRLRGFAPPFLTAVPEPGIVQVQPLHRSTYAEEISNSFAVVEDMAGFSAEAWSRYEQTIVKPNLDPARPVAGYATSVRKRRRAGCPVHAE